MQCDEFPLLARSRTSLRHIARHKAVIHFDSITLATSPRHSEHKPTSNKSPALTAPEKLAIVTSWRHLPYHTVESKSFLLLLGMLAHNLAAGAVNVAMDPMGITTQHNITREFLAAC
jgi:hypothetical protein